MLTISNNPTFLPNLSTSGVELTMDMLIPQRADTDLLAIQLLYLFRFIRPTLLVVHSCAVGTAIQHPPSGIRCFLKQTNFKLMTSKYSFGTSSGGNTCFLSGQPFANMQNTLDSVCAHRLSDLTAMMPQDPAL